jgi:hypothetical protein
MLPLGTEPRLYSRYCIGAEMAENRWPLAATTRRHTMELTTRDTITEKHLGQDAMRELVLLGIKAKYPNESITGVLEIKPSERSGFDLTLQRAPQDADFIRAILDVEAEHAAQALNQLTRAGNYWLSRLQQ